MFTLEAWEIGHGPTLGDLPLSFQSSQGLLQGSKNATMVVREKTLDDIMQTQSSNKIPQKYNCKSRRGQATKVAKDILRQKEESPSTGPVFLREENVK